MKRHVSIVGLTLAGLVFGAATTSAIAAPVGDASTTGSDVVSSASMTPASMKRAFTPTELDDLQSYADQNGRRLGDVAAQFNGLADFESLADDAKASMPEAFVGAVWGFGQGTITVRPGAGATVRTLAGGHSPKTSVVERDLPSEREQQALVASVAEALAGGSEGSLDVYYEMAGNRVVTSVGPGAKALSQAVPAGLKDRAIAIGTRVDVVETDTLQQEATARGGMVYGGCTGGFIVSGSGTRGISTAAHCTTKPSSYDGNSLGTTATPYITSYDLRWTTFTSGTSGNSFQYTSGGYRNATSTGNAAVGGVVCKYGKTTGSFCTTVASTGHCDGQYCQLLQTVSGSVQPGDSGGPWYYGNKALGITHGFVYKIGYPGSPIADLFTGVTGVTLLGVTVVTS